MTPIGIAPQRPKTVLVTGAHGIIGAEVVRQLTEQGDRVVAFAFNKPGTPPRQPAPEPVITVYGDGTKETDVLRAFDAVPHIDSVVHLAARSHVRAGTPIEVFSTNVLSTFTILAIAASRGVTRAVIASSIHATGVPLNHHGILPQAFPLSEDDSYALDDWYSLSKRTDELTAAMVSSRWGLPVLALRFPLVKDPADLKAASLRLQTNPARGVREGWSYLTLQDGGRAVRCALDADTQGAHVMHLAASETLMPDPTMELLARYAPGVPLLQEFHGRQVPVCTKRAAQLIEFTPEQSIDIPAIPVGRENR